MAYLTKNRLCAIFILAVVFLLTAAPCAVSAKSLDDVMNSAGSEENTISIHEAREEAKNQENVWLKNVISWIPIVGAVFFVVGIMIGVLSTKSNEHRRWGIRMAVIESVATFAIYLIACIAYDHYFGAEDSPVTAGEFYVIRYSEISKNIGGVRQVYDEAVAAGSSKLIAVFGLLRAFLKEASIPIGVTSFVCGLTVFFMAVGKKNVRLWAIIGLCLIVPLAIIIGNIQFF